MLCDLFINVEYEPLVLETYFHSIVGNKTRRITLPVGIFCLTLMTQFTLISKHILFISSSNIKAKQTAHKVKTNRGLFYR